jgi:lysophospholipase L1-like esterase
MDFRFKNMSRMLIGCDIETARNARRLAMRVRLIGFSLFLTLLGPGLLYAAGQPQYYLALGDSLAVGVQPAFNGTLVETNQGYVDSLFALLQSSAPGLRLKKLGCSGETTTTMKGGGICFYPHKNQLDEAVKFLQTHRVALVTLDIGGDDVLHCFSLSGPDPVCLADGVAAVNSNLPDILTALRAAAPDVPIVAMNYYDPFLAAWLLGPAGQVLASQSLAATLTFNSLLQGWYNFFGIPVADVAAAYHITDPTPVPPEGIPLNVFLALTLTWIAAPPPVGPDIHPNALGYSVIAGAFVETIGAP